ncbi:MAG TPA: S8 family serine peptidase [Pyrinomonadaceae bacterium]|nr:S8 family serine peptidase [Pyrinomonadaceae bacterium]
MSYLKVKFIATSVLIIIAGAAILTSLPRVTAQREDQLSEQEQTLLQIAAKQEGLDASRLKLLKTATVELPLTGRHIQTAKVLNTGTGQAFATSIDDRGQVVDIATLKAEEQSAYRAKYGKLHPKLHKKVEDTRADQKIKVAFWVNATEDLDREDPRNGSSTDLKGDEVDALLGRRMEQVRAATSRATEGLTRALEQAGNAVERRGEGAPMVFATLPAGLVKQFAERADVEVVYLAQDEEYKDHMNVAGPSIKADALWNLGINGAGSRIAIIEDSRVDFNNSCLSTHNLGTRVPNDPNVDDHATACAGIATSTHNNFSGIAPGAGIYSSNIVSYANFANITAAMDAAALNADVSNNSWGLDGCGYDGTVNVWGRQADYIVRYIWDTVTASAGNNGFCSSKGYVNSVGAGFNTIAVGNYDDNGTVDSADNVMSSTSSWEDPISLHGDREKPEVAAPGTNIKTTIMAPNFNCNNDEIGSGTSFSAPAVAGLAADLMQARPGLRVFPESVKALILAGATDNVEGAAGLSEKDGAGGVNALTSYNSVINNRFTWRYVTPSSFDASRNITIDMGWVNAGQRVKVALVWDSTPTSDYLTDPLKADLDLYVYGPTQAQYSVSWDNSYEIVDFTAATSGSYQIKVHNWRFDGVNEYVAVAWSLT